VCLVGLRLVVRRFGPGGLFRINVRIGRRAGHAKLLVGPVAEIYQPAAFGTKRTRRIIIPLGGFSAGGTFHKREKNGVNRKVGAS
jgi:hypothetical protein